MRKRELMVCPKCGRLANARVKSTNHPFHFVMSILTVGFWFPIWLLCVIECMFHRPKIECHCDKLVELNPALAPPPDRYWKTR